MTLRVGVNARTFTEPEPGGAVQAAKKLTSALINREDIDVVLFGHEKIRSEFPETRVSSQFYYGESQVFGVLWERILLPSLARKENVDVLFCPNGNAPLTHQPFPVVTCIHDVNAINGFTSGLHRAYRRATIPRVAHVSNRIVTVSEFSKSEIVESVDVDSEKIAVVHNGVDDIFHEDGIGTPVDLPEPYVLFVGSVNPRKNVSRAVEAFQQLDADATTDYSFVLVGPGNKDIFDTLEVPEDDRIVTPGFLSQPELKYAYTHAEVFLYPSLYEGFGLPPLEAMACGTPVVVSDAASLPEVVGDAGEYVDPYDVSDIRRGIEAVVDDESRYQQLVQAGEKRAETFTWSRTGKRVREALENVGPNMRTSRTRGDTDEN
mgnify:CR=1 FL=1